MKIYFDPARQGFWHEGVQDNIPNSAVQITENQYNDIYNSINLGNIVDIVDGVLIHKSRLITYSPNVERAWRDAELSRSDIELNKVQDADPKSTGTVADWRNYRKLLRALPEKVGFPNPNVRPIAPDRLGV